CVRVEVLLFLALLLAGCQCALPCSKDDPFEPPELPHLPNPFVCEDGLPPGARIVGNVAVSTADLAGAAEIELDAFAKHHREADAQDAAWSMEQYLLAEGYVGATVDFGIEGDVAIFRVDEGRRANLSGIQLVGVTCLDPEDLLEYFDLSTDAPLGLGATVYDRQIIDDGIEQIEREYRLNGFQYVTVHEPEEHWNAKHDCVRVTIRIEEGCRTCVQGVHFEGVAPCDMGLIGKPYNGRIPYQAAGRVRSGLLDRGRQFATVKGTARLVREPCCRADIDIVAVPGPCVRVEEICLRSLDRTRYSFARGLVPLRRGDVLYQGKIDQAQESFFRSGLFRSVNAEVKPTGPDTADLVFDLPELEARSVEIQAGWGSYELARGSLRYVDRNLFGIGRRFEAETRASLKGWAGDVDLIDPWIFGPDRQLLLHAGYERREEPSYTFQRIELSAAAEAVLLDTWRLSGGYRFRSEKASDIKGDIDADTLDGFVNAAGLFAEVAYDTRDSVLLPTRGTLAEVGTFWSNPALGADLDYLELRGRVVHLVPLGPAVLAVGASARVKEILDGAATLPIQERYFLGGESSVRSFDESELGPVDDDGDPIGGLTAAEAHVELRVPLGLGDLHGAAFYDVGVVNEDAWDFSGPLGHAIGAGLRWYFPFGPVRLDVAYNPGERFAADSDWIVHFSLGFSF
ncbi:MAG: BamA/TamA family outer membrane protein, partial [Planctomycetes bacterium]|nr:BamA/TamA family outer membrane protein [Planctomycetota bacterium]